MLGSIEELQKDIELFQKNVAASSELQTLLKQLLEQIDKQNSEFNTQSSALIARVDNLPSIVENANITSNNKVKTDVSAEIDRALQSFANKQNSYIQSLEQTKQQIQGYIDQLQIHEKMFVDKSSTVMLKIEGLPAAIESENTKSNLQIKSDIESEIQKAIQKFASEQEEYLHAIEDMKQQLHDVMEHVSKQEKSFETSIASSISKFDDSIDKVIIDNTKSREALKTDIDKMLEQRNRAFVEEQNKYIDSLKKTQSNISECENQLASKYSEFVDTLQKMNISNLYEQNIQLRHELKKRTTVLFIISVISIVVGLIGIIF